MRYRFEDYELDTDRIELSRRGALCHLEPQVFGVLAYLVEQHERAVTKDELLERVWGHTFVSDATLSSRIMAARKAIGDSGREQRLIRTIHGRGFRFVGDLQVQAPSSAPTETSANIAITSLAHAPTPTVSRMGSTAPVGREMELGQLRGWLDRARQGYRQVVFVTGEAGRGKTTLVEALLVEAREDQTLRIATGQCVEHQGEGEPYFPILDALGRLARGPDGPALTEMLAVQAPTWLIQMPWLVSPEELTAIERRTQGATRARMLREMAETIDALAAARPLILVLEDLHWGDYSTLDLLAVIARRPDPAQLLVLTTYRSSAVGQPLRSLTRDLRMHGHCTELALAALQEGAVEEYLRGRVGNARVATELAPMLHRRTEGNPLFMRSLVDWWIARGRLDWTSLWDGAPAPIDDLTAGVPETVRDLIEQQLGELEPEDQAILEAASAGGVAFAAAAIAAGIGVPHEEVEARCTALARRACFLEACEPTAWPDGTLTSRYTFAHQLHQEVLYERIPVVRRAMLHRGLARRLETGYGPEVALHASELADHFLRGRDTTRAVEYLHLAAEHALRYNAHREAVGHLTKALQLVRELPDGPERSRRELAIQSALGPALIPIHGWAAPAVEAAYRRARDLCSQLGEPPELIGVLYGLATLHEYRGDFHISQALMEERLNLLGGPDAQGSDPSLLVETHELLACSLFHQGAFTASLEHAQRALRLYDRERDRSVTSLYGKNAGVACHAWAAQAFCLLGDQDAALGCIRDAVDLADHLEHLYSLASARSQAAFIHQYREEPEAALEWADATIGLANEHGFRYRVATGLIVRGWALAMLGQGSEGITELRRGLATYQETGAQMERPYYLGLLAQACSAAGQPEEGLTAVTEGLAMIPPGRSFFYEAELHRLRGVLLMDSQISTGSLLEAEACFRTAMDIASRQGADTLMRRAARNLADLGPDGK